VEKTLLLIVVNRTPTRARNTEEITEATNVIHIPAKARGPWGEALRDELSHLAANIGSEHAWTRFFMMAKCCLRPTRPSRGHRRLCRNQEEEDNKDPVKVMCGRISKWQQGDFLALWEEVSGQRRSKPPRRQAQDNTRRIVTLAEDGHFARAAQALTATGTAPYNVQTLLALQALHPHAHEPPATPDEESPPDPLSIPPELVLKKLGSFPKGTGPGASQWRAKHLLDVVRFCPPDIADPCLRKLTLVINLLVAGKAPDSLAEILASAKLIGISKKDGGVRPIAVGEILRRLASKCCCSLIQARAQEYFAPLQVGVGTRGGTEALIHATASLLEEHGHCDKFVLLKVDFKNAFNMVDRSKMLALVREHFPELFPWVRFCYSGEPKL
jgi:hypothetical protein